MRIKMLRGAVASPDGMNVYGYEAGETYTASTPLDHSTHPLPVSELLARLFVAEGWAEDVGATAYGSDLIYAPPRQAEKADAAPAPAQAE